MTNKSNNAVPASNQPETVPHSGPKGTDDASSDSAQFEMNWQSVLLLPFHPFLLAAFPVLTCYAVNYHEATFADALGALSLSLAMATMLTLLLGAFFPNRQRAGIAVTLVVVLFFSYGIVYGLNPYLARLGAPVLLRDRYLMPVWNLMMLFGVYALYRFDIVPTAKLTRGLNVFGLLLLVLSCLSVLASAWESQAHYADPTFAQLGNEAITLKTPKQPRDVYYLVFDRYASGDVLKEDFGFDNGDFLNSLQQRGFQVASQSRANYPKTEISMASALNMTYHADQLASMFYYRDMVENHRVGKLMTSQGYDYIHLGCPLDGLRKNPQAKANYRFSRMPTEFREQLFKLTPLYNYFPATDIRTQVTQKFDLIRRSAVAATGQPKFVYAHFLVPHNPWKFDRDGNMLSVAAASQRSESENYVNQLMFTNEQILQTIDHILKHSKVEPVIIVQADEGPELRYQSDRNKTELAKIKKRCGIITAMHLPDSDVVLAADFSPVNTFRLVFNEYFDADLAMLENKSFYWSPATSLGKPDWTKAGEFMDVTEQVKSTSSGEPAAVAGN